MFKFSQCHLAFNTHIHVKKKQPITPFPKGKLLFFSALIAICQRNNHFFDCKGTHNYLIKQHFNMNIYNYLTQAFSY